MMVRIHKIPIIYQSSSSLSIYFPFCYLFVAHFSVEVVFITYDVCIYFRLLSNSDFVEILT